MTPDRHAGSLTGAQRELMRHALGLTRSTESYRNYFCADDGHDDMPTIKQLTFAGYMAITRRINGGRDGIYIVTDAGRAILSANDVGRLNGERDDG